MTRIFTDTKRLNALIANSGRNTSEMAKAVGFRVEALAKMKAPVDKGALRNSIYTATKDNNNPPDVATETLPNPSDKSVYVGPSVEYGIYQELGTSNMEAQPYMLPAIQQVENELQEYGRIILNE